MSGMNVTLAQCKETPLSQHEENSVPVLCIVISRLSVLYGDKNMLNGELILHLHQFPTENST